MENLESYKNKVNSILSLIADAHKRMATNRDLDYRAKQQEKIDKWQEELTNLYETNISAWIHSQ